MYDLFLKKKNKELLSKNIYLRYPIIDDWKEWAELRQKSKSFLQPWEPQWPKNFLTKNSFNFFINDNYRMSENNSGYNFFIFHYKKDILMGGISLTNLRFGAYQSVNMGYWMGKDFSGKGYMQEAIKCICNFCFKDLQINRIEAACIPRNIVSKRVLISSGFAIEGFARKYLKINGKFEDHILFAKLKKKN